MRIFVYDSRELPDPDPNMTVDQVRQHYVPFFAELSNATTKKEVKRGDDMVYEFEKRVGTKGQTEPIMFKCEASMWDWLAREGNPKPFDVREWDLSDARIYKLHWHNGGCHQGRFGVIPGSLRGGKPEVESIAFLNKETGETITRRYLGMEFTDWAPGWVFLLLGDRCGPKGFGSVNTSTGITTEE